MTMYKNLGRKIRKMRLSQGLSQEQLAEECSLSASYISCIERGTKKANLEKLEKLSQKLNFIIDIHPKYNTILDDIDFELISKLSNYDSSKKDFFNKVVRCIISGLETNHCDW